MTTVDATRAVDSARYLADAGRVLEHFDPQRSLQAILDLAVPALADAAFIHLKTAGAPIVAAAAHYDPEARAALPIGASMRISSQTAVARVLAGGPAELVAVDDAVLRAAAQDDAHVAALRARGYRHAVVAPLGGRDGVLGAVTFSLIRPERSYGDDDLAMLVELARRTGIALENHRLFVAEQHARRRAEEARDRARRLQELTATLSGALEEAEVTQMMVSAGASALGADGGFAWLLRRDAVLELVAIHNTGGVRVPIDDFKEIELRAHVPVCDAVKTGLPMMFESANALSAGYSDRVTPDATSFRAWAVIPFVVAGTAVGAVSFSFKSERAFSEDDRELLLAMMAQASLALERCKLLEAERQARRRAENARAREQGLHVLAGRLSTALTTAQVAAIISEGTIAAVGAYSALAALRTEDVLVTVGAVGARNPALLAAVATIPITASLPIAEAVRRNELVWCADRAQILARYPGATEMAATVHACGAIPFTFEGRTIGAIGIGCDEPRHLSAEDRETLQAIGQLGAQAFERARLYDALRTSEDQLRDALITARAGTWLLDLRTMRSKRDASYAALLGATESHFVNADFGHVHPDDRDICARAFERTMRDGSPYNPEVRVLCADGSYKWLRSFARIIRDANGEPRTLAGLVFDNDEAKKAALRAEQEQQINETLYRLAISFTSELDHRRLVQLITNELSRLVGAELAAFFGGAADHYALQAISSGEAARFHGISRPTTPTPLLARTFVEHQVVRLDDVRTAPDFRGAQPATHPAVASYLAVPVVARSGEVYGTLLFGHSQVGQFTEQHERLATGVASQAAIALENARLYRTVREHEDELEAAVERARVADRRKDEFLAMLGHELRNPLAPIATALELMDLKAPTGVLDKEREVIRRQVEHMSRLIEDLLDVSRITRGKIQLTRHVQEISGVIAKAIEMASPLLEKRLQRLTIEVPHTGLLVDADPTRLAQVFQNLLTNASKYSEPRTQVTVRAYANGKEVVVEVSDAGIGIAPELMPRLFDLFVQGERALDRAEGGLGIGLTIAKSLCDLHGGTIEASSPGTGQGSTFTVRLPKAAESSLAPSERETAKMPKLSRGARVLVVDDNVDSAEMLHEYLCRLGHEPAVAHDAVAALELVSTFQPDIAVLDIGLPVMDGYELARRLREQLGPEKLRLIAMTGYGREADRARANEAGFDHHLVKPVALEALTSLLDRVR